ncbi:MAG: hypothetical protein OXG61_08425 [Chloroflexi bacterium]|nr:hypothetical protein [Chloroflexota bacterium]
MKTFFRGDEVYSHNQVHAPVFSLEEDRQSDFLLSDSRGALLLDHHVVTASRVSGLQIDEGDQANGLCCNRPFGATCGHKESVDYPDQTRNPVLLLKDLFTQYSAVQIRPRGNLHGRSSFRVLQLLGSA